MPPPPPLLPPLPPPLPHRPDRFHAQSFIFGEMRNLEYPGDPEPKALRGYAATRLRVHPLPAESE